jgi:hypothetical protein
MMEKGIRIRTSCLDEMKDISASCILQSSRTRYAPEQYKYTSFDVYMIYANEKQNAEEL